MIRRAFTMKLKRGALAQYKRHHDDIWPEMVREIERSGIAAMTIFHHDGTLFLFSEIVDEDAWDRLWDSDISAKWSEVMSPLMEQHTDGKVAAGDLEELFHLATEAGKKKPGVKKVGAKSRKKKTQ